MVAFWVQVRSFISMPTYAFGATGLLNHADRLPVLPLRRHSHLPPPKRETPIGAPNRNFSPESFHLQRENRRSIITSHERCKKDSEGGLTCCNSMLINEDQQRAPRSTVRSCKLAFAYSMEDLPRYSGTMGEISLNLDTNKTIVRPPRQCSPA